MLILAIENFLLFSTLFAVGGFLLAWAARAADDLGWWRPHPATLTRLYTFALIAPPLSALWVVSASLLPEALLGGAAFDTAHAMPHDLHLLGLFTAHFEPTPARLTLLFASTAFAFALWSSVRAHRSIGDIIGRLGMSAVPPSVQQVALVREVAVRHNFDVGLIVSDYPLSFVWGYSRSKLLLSSNLLNILTPEQLAGVLEHEATHHTRRDNLSKLVLTGCSRLSLIFPLTRIILKWRGEQVELICDEVAASLTAAPLEIAEALVTVRRHSPTFSHHAAPSFASPETSGFIAADTSSFERRVRRLLALADALPPAARATALSQPPTTIALAVAIIFATSLALLSTLAPLTVHHTTEFIIGLIS